MKNNRILKILAFVIMVMGTSSLDYDNFLSQNNIPFFVIGIAATIILYIAKKDLN